MAPRLPGASRGAEGRAHTPAGAPVPPAGQMAYSCSSMPRPDPPAAPRRPTRWALVGLLLLACFPRVPGDEHPALQLDPALKAAADAMDPGPQPPLHVAMPGWLKDDKLVRLAGRYEMRPSSLDALNEANAALAAWSRAPRVNPKEMLLEAMLLAHGLVRAEQAAALGADDAELLTALAAAYAELARTAHLREPLARYLARRVAGSPHVDAATQQQLREADMFFETATQRAAALALHAAARVLRERPRDAAVPHVLRQLSALRLYQGRDAEAVELYRLALERADHSTAADAAALAWLCFQALDLACGDKALAEVRQYAAGSSSGPGVAPELVTTLTRAGADAKRLVALGPGPHALAPGLERADLLHALHRDRDAEALLHTLRAAHPGDGRPAVGLAALALRHGDFLAAADLYRETAALAPRDARFAAVFLAALLASRIDLLDDDPGAAIASDEAAAILGLVGEHAARAAGQAAVLELGVRTAIAALPGVKSDVSKTRSMLAGLPADAHALAVRFPDERAAWQLVYAALGFAAHADEALAIATTPRPAALADEPELALQQARAAIGLALQWEHASLLPAIDAALAAVPASAEPDETALLRATADAIHGRLGDVEAQTRATTALRDLAEQRSGAARALPLNNLAVQLAAAGEAQAAADALSEALRADPEALAPRLNMAALAFTVDGQPHPELDAVLPALSEGPHAELRLHARAWLVALASRGHGDVAAARKQFAAELARARATSLRGAVAPGRWGFAAVEHLTVAASLTPEDTLAVEVAMTSQPWQVLPAPELDALLQAPAAPVKPRRPAKGPQAAASEGRR